MSENSFPLQNFLKPKSVAIVGVSSDFSKFTGRTLKYLLKHGYSGTIYPINPKYKEIAGLACFPSVSELPEAADTAFIQIPGGKLMGVLEECAEKGIRNTVIFSAGLGETGPEGKKREMEIRAFIRANHMRICGPNSVGFLNTIDKVALSPVVALELDHLPSGRIGFISQSGGIMGAIISRAESRGIGFSYVVSTGNELDLGVSDFIRIMLHDPHTKVISLFLEAIREPEKFLEVADLALEMGKPLICLKIGKSEIGSRAAASHTGALTGSDEIYQAVFEKKGIIRVTALEDLVETAFLFEKCSPPKGKRIGVITTTGGGAMLLSDECGGLGLDFPKPSDRTIRELSDGLPSFASFSNPLDVTGSGVGGGYERSLNLLLEDEEFDVVVSVVGSSSQFEPEMGVNPILRRNKDIPKPLVAFLNPNAEAATRLLVNDGVPTFRTPEGCARALKHFCDYGDFLRKKSNSSFFPEHVRFHADQREVERILGSSNTFLNEFEGKKLLSQYGIPCVKEVLVQSVEEAVRAAQMIGYPVAMKICSQDIQHKTDAGFIRLGLNSDHEIEASFEGLLSRSRKLYPDAGIDGVLIQEMVEDAEEVMIGMFYDHHFGPVIMFGLGGVFVEVIKDISMKMVPLSIMEAEELVREVKGAALLKGYRGGEAKDIEGLVETILRFSHFTTDMKGRLRTAEINPLMVLKQGNGVKAVDALIEKSR